MFSPRTYAGGSLFYSTAALAAALLHVARLSRRAGRGSRGEAFAKPTPPFHNVHAIKIAPGANRGKVPQGRKYVAGERKPPETKLLF
jgi:hypothetical protein